MSLSKKIEGVPEKDRKRLESSLNELVKKNASTATVRDLSSEAGIDEEYTVAVLEALEDEGEVQSMVELSCPNCDCIYSTHSTQSLPEGHVRCDLCGNQFDSAEKRNWRLTFELRSNHYDFFSDFSETVRYYCMESASIPEPGLISLYEDLKSVESPSKRGIELDYYVGIIFSQIEGVNVVVKEQTETGELDVIVKGYNPPGWFADFFGLSTMVENKWEKSPISPGYVHQFCGQSETYITDSICNRILFISINGFTDKAMNAAEGRSIPVFTVEQAGFERVVKSGDPRTFSKL
ncbi:hypothetical protein [Halobaculum sp. MBLA0143]|uniref:hypothetical protein n=1 Tax=Halobaculum sp. MBLA0143 TaxID=3079933 RepID=UPI0035241AC5